MYVSTLLDLYSYLIKYYSVSHLLYLLLVAEADMYHLYIIKSESIHNFTGNMHFKSTYSIVLPFSQQYVQDQDLDF